MGACVRPDVKGYGLGLNLVTEERISKLDGSDVSNPRLETSDWTFKTATTGPRAFTVQFKVSNLGFETSDPSNFEILSSC
jgi:hypothetical protein